MENNISCVKLVDKEKVITTVLPVKAIEIITPSGGLHKMVYFIFSPFSLN